MSKDRRAIFVTLVIGLIAVCATPPATCYVELGETPIMTAAARGSITGVRALTTVRCGLDAKDHHGYTALMYAINWRHPECAKVLIERGANVSAATPAGYTALIFAASHNEPVPVKLICGAHANVNARTSKYGYTALNYAAPRGFLEVARLLCDAGADVNAQESTTGRTALMEAADDGQTECVKLLLARRANVNLTDRKGRSALDYARWEKQDEIAKLIVAAPPPPNPTALRRVARP
ncbi:MAG: ankyrin repeat domain-containing protein [Capsulimonadaceae bacterium]|nr:ankyrin repeat domain-containing protein [Capsulimonadaceae bacterium]